jgi:hypothetical protein
MTRKKVNSTTAASNSLSANGLLVASSELALLGPVVFSEFPGQIFLGVGSFSSRHSRVGPHGSEFSSLWALRQTGLRDCTLVRYVVRHGQFDQALASLLIRAILGTRTRRITFLVKSLIALGWLRDIVLVLLLCAGNHLRHSSPTIGLAIMTAALLIFAERFLWAWHICDLREKNAASSAPR